ncbi:MAG: hypothetical protein H0U79_02815 [Solirubrobacterales bacterium]|nr:hypothetical protein [Solirubrobacterales bacterium]
MAQRMRQSLDTFEEAFAEEADEDRARRLVQLREAQRRMRLREAERTRRYGTVRFLLLALTLVVTAILVAVVMFRTLYVVMG